MTATATQVSQNVAVSEKEWVKLFPRQVTENYTSSVTFMKQLTLVAVSTITYLKNAFPEESYSTETFGGLKLKLLKHKCCDDLAQFVGSALQQAWDAFDKKFIHQLALCFYENDCQAANLIEYHIFEYSYSSDGVTLNINSKNRNSEKRTMKCSFESVKARTTMFIRTLTLYVLQQCQQELPVSYDVSLRLYYNEDAPEGYQAPGFSSNPEPDHLEPTASDAIRLGWVETPYHKLIARTYIRDMFPASDEAMASPNTPVLTQAEKQDYQGSRSSVAESSEAEVQVHCPCNKLDVTDLTALITCQYCQTQQHAACFGFLTSVPKEHCCANCYDADGSRRPSDAQLVPLNQKKRECLCIFRRTLELCTRVSSMDGQMLADKFGISAVSVSRMIKLLQSHYIVPNTDADDLIMPRKINPIRLKLALKRFFQNEQIEEDNMVDRLMAENAASQENSDPIGDVLSPLEKITLHNTSNLGQIIENPIDMNTSNIDNKTLQQYRQAVLINEDISEELPLSGSHNPVKNVEEIGKKKPLKRKNDDEECVIKPKLRSGARTKKSRAMSFN